MQATTAGFRNAPVTKGLLFLTGGLSVLVGVTNVLPHLKLQNLTEGWQLWKLATNHFFFTSPGELLFGLILIYYFRVLERQMGSAKFGAFAFLSFATATLIQVAYLALFQTSSQIVSGPYAFIFAAFVLFYSCIPPSSRFRFLGANLSDKFFVYILGLQLLFSHSTASFVTGVSGILGGLAYRSPALPLSSFRLPHFVSKFCAAVLLPLLKSSDTRRVPRRARRPPSTDDIQAFGRGATPTRVEPSEDVIQELTAMGFDRMMVIQALRAAQGDPTLATNILLNQYQ